MSDPSTKVPADEREESGQPEEPVDTELPAELGDADGQPI